MRVVVDTNIIFSALLNTSGHFGKILIHFGSKADFYSCDFLLVELESHHLKLKKLTKLSSSELGELIALVTKKVKFINERLIPERSYSFAQKQLAGIDEKDIPFLALAHFMKARLWTGDRKLKNAIAGQSAVKQIDSRQILSYLQRL